MRSSSGPFRRSSFTLAILGFLPLSASAHYVAPPVPAVPAAPAAPASVSPLPTAGTYTVTGDAKSLSVFAVSVDAQELLTAIATRAGLPLVVDDSVSRKITINLSGRSARQAVADIAGAFGLSMADVDGVTMISEGIPRSPSSYLLSDIATIPTKYVVAANARNLLPVFLQDYVKVNAEQNAVVLSAPSEVLDKFRDDIAQFDIPASQITVELLLVELTNTSLDQLGLQVGYLNAGQGPSINSNTGTIAYTGLATLTRQFQLNLQALQSQGKARVRANPRVATVSGRKASIFVGNERYVATPIDNGQGGQKNSIDAGVRLDVTPYTGGKGQVLVDVDTEVSTLSAPDPITGLPTKSTRTATTTVRADDGQTIVIGGLTQQELRSVRTKIPILGDLPILGPALFQSKNITDTQTELVLFITPRILSETGHLPADEEKALKDRFLDSDLSKPIPPTPDKPLPAIPGGFSTSPPAAAPPVAPPTSTPVTPNTKP
jgi:type IV pilus assembly protein PilQ